MRADRDPDLIPFFGCGPHTPDRVAAAPAGTDRAARRKAACPTCRGKPQLEGSPFVCMGCHGVAPEHQARFDELHGKAIATREPERNVMARTVAEKCDNRFILTGVERSELVEEFPDLAPQWLASIGQTAPDSAPKPTPAAGRTPKKPSRRKNREAAARAKVATA